MQDDPTPYTLRSAIFGGPLILMQQITEWDDEQIDQTRQAIAEYKDLRGLIRDAKIIHLLPPRHNVERDRLGLGRDPGRLARPGEQRRDGLPGAGRTGRRK